ncbi:MULTISPECIES: type I secretion system permease/ATPase [unclassified Enterobacter]|uniref:type I secretion system permease/ATPase n=1 Tax=unclassified Enterobacter TaxID=2608935 RepID=UPI0015C69B96|nr:MULTISPECIES: type I secretion system permease/ATPase [unclassified Enterobacter]MBB3307163.1 ATP-binding cassette subfamily C protein LapB [Enterobacter sp. Sphag1F]NYI16232.1 ATP-binding cassette subfamily C protein LapB [Enterobacter sp. Sphag71]
MNATESDNQQHEQELQSLARVQTRIDDTLLQSVDWLCRHYGLGRSFDALTAGLPKDVFLTPSQALSSLESAGMTPGLVERSLWDVPQQVMPVILVRKESGGCILLDRVRKKNAEDKMTWFYQVVMPEVGSKPVEIEHAEIAEWYSGFAIFSKPTAKVDRRVEEGLPENQKHWLFSTLWRYRRYYRSAAVASVLINVLALASIFFTMNVYDRVIPNQAFVTLWSLAIGVTVAMLFEALTRFIRAHLLDTAGKKADLIVGSILFRQAIDVRMEHKPASSGTFANQLREFESLRDFVSSATLAALADLPFVLLFVGVIFAISGPLGFVPLLMLPVIIIISVIIQWPLAKIMKENLKDAALKQGVLIESIEGMETLKATGGGVHMQRRWQKFSALQANSGSKSKRYSTLATTSVTFLQQFQTVMLILIGVYMIDAGNLTMGGLIGTVMLAGRATGPLGQVIGLATRYQSSKAALGSLNRLMEMPTDRDSEQDYIANPELKGDLSLKGVGFSYPAPPMQPNPEILKNINIDIKAGERIAILGSIGSGKSTLLRLMARLYQPTGGQLFTDGLDVNQIDPADWRRHIGFVSQESRLFYGTLRENVMLGMPDAAPNEFLRVLRLTGLDQIAARHPLGINLAVGENGGSLSGGQRQLVALARTLLSRPEVLLLDEPTSAMDSQTEQQFLKHLHAATQGQTLVVVTHRPSLLALVDRIIVIDAGKVAIDGPKDVVLARLSGQPVPPANSGKVSAAAQQPAANTVPQPAANQSAAPANKPASPIVTRSVPAKGLDKDVEVSA